MQTDLLQKVKEDPGWRLDYHLMPETGWLNDPNGLCQFKGRYHVFHQYEPHNAKGGATHWGHKTSTNLVDFQEEEMFISPDQPFDKDGAYSGSAIEAGGKLHIFYTGNVKKAGYHDYLYSGREQNVVHIVSLDGFEIEKREVVIRHQDFPEGFTDHIRDPNLFEMAGKYYMLLGSRTLDHRGAIIAFESDNLDDWVYRGKFLEGHSDQGFMWECPDFFQQKDQSVLLLSPQGLAGDAFNFQNPYTAGYLIGDLDQEAIKFKPQTGFQELDYGFDFYAPQTFEDERGRQIMWAWMGMADHEPEYINPTVSYGWQHALTMPRELILEGGELLQRPLVEYESLRGQLQTEGPIRGEVYELQVQFEEAVNNFSLKLRQDTVIRYDGRVLTLEHGRSGYGRRKRQLVLDDLEDLTIFSDRSSLEIFINGGSRVMTTRVYPIPGSDQISLETEADYAFKFWPLKKEE